MKRNYFIKYNIKEPNPDYRIDIGKNSLANNTQPKVTAKLKEF